MNGLLVLGLFALIPVLFVAAHVYASAVQEQRVTVIVHLDSRASAEMVAAEHARRYGNTVFQTWDTSVAKGYRTALDSRYLGALRNDERVSHIERLEDD